MHLVLLCADQIRRQEGYIAPKRPYGFDDMLDDILDFAVVMLVDNGRLSMWMPTANDEDIELAIPTHPGLKLQTVCVQTFNKCKCDRAALEAKTDRYRVAKIVDL